MLERSEPIIEGGFVRVVYSGQPGDELPLHSHRFNHTTRVLEGEVEAFDGAGKALRRTVADVPLEFPAGRRHGIRCITAARFENRSPILGDQQENG